MYLFEVREESHLFFFLIMSSLSEIAKVTNSGGEIAIFEVISYLIHLRMLLFCLPPSKISLLA